MDSGKVNVAGNFMVFVFFMMGRGGVEIFLLIVYVVVYSYRN